MKYDPPPPDLILWIHDLKSDDFNVVACVNFSRIVDLIWMTLMRVRLTLSI
jgi:hypothetical protein